MASDPVKLAAARTQLAAILAAGDMLAFLGWWDAWSMEPGASNDDLSDVVKQEFAVRDAARKEAGSGDDLPGPDVRQGL